MVLFLVINIGIIISVSVILKTIKLIVIPIYLHCCNIPKGILNIVPIVPKIAVTSISLKLQQLSIIPEGLRIGSQSSKC